MTGRIPVPPIPRLPERSRLHTFVVCLLLLVIVLAGALAAYIGGTP